MAHGTSLSMRGDRLVVVKQAQPGPEAQRLHREAEILHRAAQAGVVELIATEELDGGGVRLCTAFVGGGSLAERSGEEAGSLVAPLLASVATTLAGLHERGIAHERVTADHVLVAEGAQAVLCGLAEAVDETDIEARRSAAATDVAAVGALLRDWAGGGATTEPALRAIAERALADDLSARPSAGRLAEALRELAVDTGPGTHLPAATGHHGRRLLPRSAPARRLALSARTSRPRLAVVGSLAALAVMAVVLITAMVGSPGNQSDDAGLGRTDTAVGPLPETTRPAPTTTAPDAIPTPDPLPPPASPSPSPITDDGPDAGSRAIRVWPPPACEAGPTSVGAEPLVTEPLGAADPVVKADIDGDGCTERIEVNGGVVRAGDLRWAVAAANDVVLVGDWDCDALATPAVLRPGSGQVWHYARWARPNEDLPASLATTVPGAVTATVEPAREAQPNCDTITVLDASGTLTRIEPTAPPG
ncbi:MAG: hypothetical protein M3535_05385 [Actinomycetota bacterium]|nr:hypothetical protein [Actinomycetota bacterium]